MSFLSPLTLLMPHIDQKVMVGRTWAVEREQSSFNALLCNFPQQTGAVLPMPAHFPNPHVLPYVR